MADLNLKEYPGGVCVRSLGTLSGEFYISRPASLSLVVDDDCADDQFGPPGTGELALDITMSGRVCTLLWKMQRKRSS